MCEITLSLLRANKDTLISVLHTFLYDPLVEWSKTKVRRNARERREYRGERERERAEG